MAKSQRKASNAKPITAHPLFPAVVALWFGALFGLGSLAVRPSLLESVVIASRIDLLIPAAAPPLGVTARILVALGLSALGSAIGLLIARRITRPKVEVRQRKRTGVAREETAASLRGGDVQADYPVRRPIAAHDALDADEAGGAGMLAGRRRSLAVELPEQAYVPHDMAPLPGGAPQIFSISELELDAGMADAASAVDPAGPLDLGSFAAPVDAAPALDWAAAAPAAAASPEAPLPLPAAMQVPGSRQEFVAPAEPAFAEPVAAAPARQIFGAAIVDDHVPQEFVQAAGFKTSVFEVEEVTPLFVRPVPTGSEPRPEPTPEPMPEARFEPQPQPAHQPESPADAVPLPPLGTMGMADLAARLADSMRRRREARAAAAVAAPSAAVPAEDHAVQPEVAQPEPYTPFAQYAPSEPIPAPFARSAPVPDSAPAPVAAAEPAPPVGLARLNEAAPTVAMAPEDGAAITEVPSAPLAMPAALRPLALEDPVVEDEDDVLASLLPPRQLTMPAADPVAPVAEIEPAETTIEDEALGAEDKCGSLLDLGLPTLARPQFVRIEEPEADAATFEPVVIFPGQAALGMAAAGSYAAAAAPAFAPAPTPFAAAADSAPFRQFDAPSSLGAGQPVVNPAAAAALDPAETERALRAALANLQRMSGAA